MQRNVLGLLLLLTLAALAVVLMGSDALVGKLLVQKNGRIARDMNYDQRIDYWETWSHGVLLMIEQDTNGDGRVDTITRFRNNKPYEVDADTNYDGRFDYRETWGPHGQHRVEIEKNGKWETAPVR